MPFAITISYLNSAVIFMEPRKKWYHKFKYNSHLIRYNNNNATEFPLQTDNTKKYFWVLVVLVITPNLIHLTWYFLFFHPFCIILSYLVFSFFSTTLPYEFVETVRNERKYVGSFAEKGRRLRRDVSLSAALRGECRNLGAKGSNNRLKVTYRASIGLISR